MGGGCRCVTRGGGGEGGGRRGFRGGEGGGRSQLGGLVGGFCTFLGGELGGLGLVLSAGRLRFVVVGVNQGGIGLWGAGCVGGEGGSGGKGYGRDKVGAHHGCCAVFGGMEGAVSGQVGQWHTQLDVLGVFIAGWVGGVGAGPLSAVGAVQRYLVDG